MAKAYFVEENGCCDPKVVLLGVNSEHFIEALYEKLYAFMATGKDIEDNARIDVCGVNVLLSSVLNQEHGAFNYKIKDLNVFDLDFIEPIQIGDSSDKLFFMSRRSYLPDTEDDFETQFILISCKSKENFKTEFKKACEKYSKKDEFRVIFGGLYFSAEDVYNIDKNKKMTIYYPLLTEIL